MNTVESSNAYQELNARYQSQQTNTQSTSDNQSMFLDLMVASVQFQDPTAPSDTSEFMDQIASFSEVEALAELSDALGSFTDSFLSAQSSTQAATYVGTTVYVENDTVSTEGDVVSAELQIESSTAVATINVFDESGQQVDQISLGSLSAGRHGFQWEAAGFPPGNYRLEADLGGDQESTLSLGYKVDSVSISPNDRSLTLNTNGGSVGLNQVLRVS
jgi:flagellar basal-body rod modification protein FlgD